MHAKAQERLVGALGAAMGVTLLGYLLFIGMMVEIHGRGEQRMTVVELQAPRPRLHRPRPHVYRPKPGKASGQASPRNLRNKAAEIVAIPPLARPPMPPLLVSAVKADVGTAASAGASDRPGPGQGAGGAGDGMGGDGGDVPPRLIKGRLRFSDLPADLRQAGVGGSVSVRYDVDVDGRVGACAIMVSSGSAELDALTCRLIQRRFRFDPSRDYQGRPVESTIEEKHSWIIDENPDQP